MFNYSKGCLNLQLSYDRLTEIAKDGIITLFLGLALSILTLIPENIISPYYKLLIAVVFVIGSLALLAVKIFYEDLQEYRKKSKRVDKYINKMPETVNFDLYDRTVQINGDGDSAVVDELEIENVSETTITTINIPSFCDIYEDPDLELLDSNCKFQVDEIIINNQNISSTENCCEREGVLFGDDNPEERVNVMIPFDKVGGLSPQDERGSSQKVTIDALVEHIWKHYINQSESKSPFWVLVFSS